MVKKSILLLSLTAIIGGNIQAQTQVPPCMTDEKFQEYVQMDPNILIYQEQLDQQFRNSQALKRSLSQVSSIFYPYTPTADSAYPMVYIPVVFHVVHDYGSEYVDDNDLYELIKRINIVYRKQNADTSQVIAPFKPYIGKPNIQFVLATKDPLGNPTTGITRTRSYLTGGGDDQAKLGLWPPNRYLNIWIIRQIGRSGVAAYSNFPSSAAANPYTDGIIGGAQYLNTNKTYEHEIGHYLNLYHPWNSSGLPVSQGCGDDEVDDTPPTRGHFGSGAPNFPSTGGNCNPVVLYDSLCAHGYMKVYNNTDTADYPDTTNVQNIMDYANCPIMFTHQQVDRMRDALKSNIGNRSNLISPLNLEVTGVMSNGTLVPHPDMKPVPAFSVERGQNVAIGSEKTYFLCADNSGPAFTFIDRSWRDTVVANGVEWSFSNGGTTSTPVTNAGGIVNVRFTEPGWATVTQKVTGNNSGDTTVSSTVVYVADKNNAIDASGSPYYQEFNDAADLEKWPMFNYYDNQTKWEVSTTTGYYDKFSMVYKAFDKRAYPNFYVGSPIGDYDDFYTPAFNLSNFGGDCNLNFLSAGVFRTSDIGLMKDTLEVFVSSDCGAKWDRIAYYTAGELANNGVYFNEYMPQWTGEWDVKSINIPNNHRKDAVFFRFRYKTHGNPDLVSKSGSGNNFYIDRLNVSSFPLGLNTIADENQSIMLAPNPTNGSSFVVISGSNDQTAKVVVTDVTGKVVYRTEQKVSGVTRVEIPAAAIAVKGVYMVQVATDSQTKTEKLLVQ